MGKGDVQIYGGVYYNVITKSPFCNATREKLRRDRVCYPRIPITTSPIPEKERGVFNVGGEEVQLGDV